MDSSATTLFSWLVALGIGLMIGTERERRHGSDRPRAPAGSRTFTITSLVGAIAETLGSTPLLATVTGGIAVLTALGYWLAGEDDRGLTSEVALIATALLGGLAMRQPQLAAGLAVVITALLASRTQIHRFVGKALTEDEAYHGLMFAAATLVVLPLLPDRSMGPFGAINLRSVWLIAVLVMGISAAGYLAVRMLGVRWGLPIAGLASGFVSSTATIGAMAARASADGANQPGAIAGAILSTVATVVQMAIVLAATSPATLQAVAGPLLVAGAAAVAYAMSFMAGSQQPPHGPATLHGEPFNLATALMFAATLTCVLLLSAALGERFGQRGAIAAAAIAGFADAHSAAVAVAALVATGKLPAADAVLPILAALTTNTISKVAVARASGTTAFAARVVPGLVLVAAGAWAGFLIPHSIR